jgi:hypothetical protein
MRVQVTDRNGKELPRDALHAIGLGNMLARIEGLWAQDVGGAVAALVTEGKARCEWVADEQKWKCTGRGPTVHCPGFEAVIAREEDEWFVTIKLYEEWDDVWFRAAAALVEQFEEFENRVRKLEEELYQLAKRVDSLERRAQRERREEGWEEEEDW